MTCSETCAPHLYQFCSPECEEAFAESRTPGPCARCGRTPAAGFASSWTAATGEVWLCHGDDDESPTCYELGAP